MGNGENNGIMRWNNDGIMSVHVFLVQEFKETMAVLFIPLYFSYEIVREMQRP
jgi:hypothetical protein